MLIGERRGLLNLRLSLPDKKLCGVHVMGDDVLHALPRPTSFTPAAWKRSTGVTPGAKVPVDGWKSDTVSPLHEMQCTLCLEELDMRTVLGASILLVVVAWAGPASPQALQPGLWETTARMEMAGMTMPPTTVRQCIRDASPENAVPQMPNCTVTSRSASGNTVRWSVRCQEGGMNMTGNGEMTLQGATSEGVLQLTLDQGGQRQQMTQRFSGRRIGNC
jgi:uncharacterized protein DUF3617